MTLNELIGQLSGWVISDPCIGDLPVSVNLAREATTMVLVQDRDVDSYGSTYVEGWLGDKRRALAVDERERQKGFLFVR